VYYILVLKCVKYEGLQDICGPDVPNVHAICLEMAEPAKCKFAKCTFRTANPQIYSELSLVFGHRPRML
jgi:hypothetical protein